MAKKAKFNPQAKCPKCTFEVVDYAYRSGDRFTGATDPTESMARRCTRCGYSWDETPADYVGESPEHAPEPAPEPVLPGVVRKLP